jgi:hypothetical protein
VLEWVPPQARRACAGLAAAWGSGGVILPRAPLSGPLPPSLHTLVHVIAQEASTRVAVEGEVRKRVAQSRHDLETALQTEQDKVTEARRLMCVGVGVGVGMGVGVGVGEWLLSTPLHWGTARVLQAAPVPSDRALVYTPLPWAPAPSREVNIHTNSHPHGGGE